MFYSIAIAHRRPFSAIFYKVVKMGIVLPKTELKILYSVSTLPHLHVFSLSWRARQAEKTKTLHTACIQTIQHVEIAETRTMSMKMEEYQHSRKKHNEHSKRIKKEKIHTEKKQKYSTQPFVNNENVLLSWYITSSQSNIPHCTSFLEFRLSSFFSSLLLFLLFVFVIVLWNVYDVVHLRFLCFNVCIVGCC